MGNMTFSIDAYTLDNSHLTTEYLEEIFFDKELCNKDKFDDIKELYIINPDRKIYFGNLKYLTNLTIIKLSDPKIIDVPKEITELVNLEELSLNKNNMISIYTKLKRLTNISKLKNLKKLSVSMTGDVFPDEILKLKNLNDLFLITDKNMDISNELCEMENLYQLYYCNEDNLSFCPNFIKKDNKMIICEMYKSDFFDYELHKNNIEEVNDLKILNCKFDKLENLPNHIEILRLGKNVKELPNLPLGLKKLYLYNYLPYFEIDKIKLPFGCELILV